MLWCKNGDYRRQPRRINRSSSMPGMPATSLFTEMTLHCGHRNSILAAVLTPKKMYSTVAQFCGCLRRIFLELVPMLLLLCLFVIPNLAIGATTAPQIVSQPLGQT